MDSKIIRFEFWNGHLTSKTKEHVTTKHNPCLWTNVNVIDKPWRIVYKEAIIALTRWGNKELNDTDFLHQMRYIAYGLGKRDYNDTTVIWPGNLTINHKPKLCIELNDELFTIEFYYEDNEWKTHKYNGANFYWDL